MHERAFDKLTLIYGKCVRARSIDRVATVSINQREENRNSMAKLEYDYIFWRKHQIRYGTHSQRPHEKFSRETSNANGFVAIVTVVSARLKSEKCAMPENKQIT